MAATQERTGYAPVNGLQMCYEIHGAGRPLVLLHGALSTIDVDFGRVLPALAQTRQVIAVEQQTHGHTADIDHPLTFEQMAEDTAALLRQLSIERADFFGYSVGARIALQVAIRHSDLVRRLVLATPVLSRDGYSPGLLEGVANLQPENLAGSPFEAAYARVAPRLDDWPALIAKNGHLPEWLVSMIAPFLDAPLPEAG